MQVVPASFTVLEELDARSLVERIEYCGRICYKSEDRIDNRSAIPFTERIIKHGHNSVLEMGALTLRIAGEDPAQLDDLYAVQPRYLQLDRLDDSRLLASGSVRAFRELYANHPGCAVIRAMAGLLANRHPYFFADLLPDGGIEFQAGVTVSKVALTEVDTLPPALKLKHRHLAVKFIVNRAVTHEIVRHRPCAFLQESQRYCRYSEDKFGGEVSCIRPLFFNEDSEEYRLWQRIMEQTETAYLKLLETSSPQAARTVLPNSCKTELVVYANLAQWRHIFRLRTSQAAEPSMREVMIPLEEEFGRRFPELFPAR
ncbi:MAG: FAD-dependent thymidylate synthase [Desulfobulbaceae bacterium A2]|nr:MAG: FAD-dependent thymidylate synthase [Desulfobulbaceae bacterium A2]